MKGTWGVAKAQVAVNPSPSEGWLRTGALHPALNTPVHEALALNQ